MTDSTETGSPFPSRRSLHSEKRSSAPTRRAGRGRSVGRLGALGVLGAFTVALPLTGFLGPQCSPTLPASVLAGTSSVSWAGEDSGDVTASSLAGVAEAASRSKARAPLVATSCVGVDTAANGTRTLVSNGAVHWPLAAGSFEITSPFGQRVSPVSGQLLAHEGIDMAASMGEPIHAIADGVVIEVGENSRSGAYVTLRHTLPDGTVVESAYLHQYMDEILVHVGEEVRGGQVIGAVGSNGWSTGPHLHFEVHDAEGTPVDPQQWMAEVGALELGQECG